jgi:hypothetical protein
MTVTLKALSAGNTTLHFTNGRTFSEQSDGYVYILPTIPEFSSLLILPLFIMATLLTVAVHRKKTHDIKYGQGKAA